MDSVNEAPNLHLDALAPASRELVDRLGGLDWMADLYLAGSAALALHLGHRRVRDLDWMGVRRLTSPERRDLLQDLLALDPDLEVERARDGLLSVRASEALGGVGLRIHYYPYPLIDSEEAIGEHAVASLVDLAAMKLAAITSRAARRDAVDLYLVTRHLDLDLLLDRAAEKFGHVADLPLLALQGLADLASAPDEPLPMTTPAVDWSTIEAWVAGEVREVARRRLGLGE